MSLAPNKGASLRKGGLLGIHLSSIYCDPKLRKRKRRQLDDISSDQAASRTIRERWNTADHKTQSEITCRWYE